MIHFLLEEVIRYAQMPADFLRASKLGTDMTGKFWSGSMISEQKSVQISGFIDQWKA